MLLAGTVGVAVALGEQAGMGSNLDPNLGPELHLEYLLSNIVDQADNHLGDIESERRVDRAHRVGMFQKKVLGRVLQKGFRDGQCVFGN